MLNKEIIYIYIKESLAFCNNWYPDFLQKKKKSERDVIYSISEVRH